MRLMLEVSIPNDNFNAALRNGTVGKTIQHILEETRPEAVYFSEREGKRGALLIVNVTDPSKIPFFAEPWFLAFNADVKFRIVMSFEELQKAGIEEIAKKWKS